MPSMPLPDHSNRPLSLTCAHSFDAEPSEVFAAWTTNFDIWFAEPGMLVFDPTPGQPWFFYNRLDWGRHPHYGRVLDIKENALVELTWLTGNGDKVGTEGAETILRIELTPNGAGTDLRLTHSGFVNEASRDGHAKNWPLAFESLSEALRT